MNRVSRAPFVIAAFFVSCLTGVQARACDTDVIVEDLWIRQPAMATASAAGFFRLRNECTEPVTLVSVTSPRYGRVEVHQSVMQGGNWTMHRRNAVTVKPGETVVFQTGDLHLMLMDPDGPAEAGEQIPVVFHFEDGREVAATADVRKR